MRKRIELCDYIRAIAAILVVLYHYTTRYDQLFGHVARPILQFPWGYMGVAAFFLLSGYLAVITLGSEMTPSKWVKTRFARLYPAYWVAVICTFVVTTLFLKERSVSLFAFLINMTMLNEFVGIPSVDGVYWTMRNEIIFYAFVFVLLVIKQNKRMKLFAWIWLITDIVIEIIGQKIEIPTGVFALMMNRYLSPFVIGITLGAMIEERKGQDFVMIGVALAYFAYKNGAEYAAVLGMMTLLFVIISYSERLQKYQAPEWIRRPLIWIAAISYPLYLIHQNIGYVVLKWLEGMGIPGTVSVLIGTALALLMAKGLYSLDKKALQPAIRRCLKI